MTNKPWETPYKYSLDLAYLGDQIGIVIRDSQLLAARALYESIEAGFIKRHNNGMDADMARQRSLAEHEKLLWPEGRKQMPNKVHDDDFGANRCCPDCDKESQRLTLASLMPQGKRIINGFRHIETIESSELEAYIKARELNAIANAVVVLEKQDLLQHIHRGGEMNYPECIACALLKEAREVSR